jgi:4-hydroxy-tetrahydrodipicolinate synthase
MRIAKKYQGVVIPMITPFTNDGKIDQAALAGILEHILSANTIPFILGTTGESPSMSDKMSVQLVTHVAAQIADRVEIYVGISDTCFDNSVHNAQKYHELGVNTFVAHLPEYYPLKPNQIFEYYRRLAEAIPGPLILYNIPATTKLSIPLDLVEELSHHDNIIGLKDSERSQERMDHLAQTYKTRQDFAIFNGWTVKSAYALLSGFDGIVPSTGNLIPQKFSDLYQAVLDGDDRTAYELQAEIDPIAGFHQRDKVLSDVIAILKIMMNELNLCEPAVLLPLLRLNSDEENQIRESFRGLNVTNHKT